MSLYSRLVRHVFAPMSLWRRGEMAQRRYERELERTQFLPPEDLRDLQWRRLDRLLRHAHARCPFYRERFRAAGQSPDDIRCLEDLRRLPVLEKRDIQERGAEMVAEGWPADDLIRNQTGGSTGAPITFFLCRDRKCSRAAATLRHNAWAGWREGDSAAVIWGAPRDRPAEGWRSRARAALLREPLWLDTAALTETSLWQFHRELKSRRPRVILAYARAAVLFARWAEQANVRLHRPEAVVTSAEVLEDEDRAVIERAFGCRVFNRYGCREVSVIASECPEHDGLHVMAEGLYVEVETPDGPGKPGEMGSILVTDLLNPAMPLIRYRIGDMGAWAAGPCRCGRGLPRLARVSGRITDFLVGSDGRLVSGVFLATYVVAHRPSLGQVQIHQERAGHVVYKVRPGPGFDQAADGHYLARATGEYLGPGATAEVVAVAELPASPSGKLLFSHSRAGAAALAGRWGAVAPGGRDALLDTNSP